MIWTFRHLGCEIPYRNIRDVGEIPDGLVPFVMWYYKACISQNGTQGDAVKLTQGNGHSFVVMWL